LPLSATNATIADMVSFDGNWRDTTDVLEAQSLEDLDDETTATNVFFNRDSG
jgi:hypothetical protein